jgi:hypothetical protein
LNGTSVIKALSRGIKDQKAMLDCLDENTRMVYASKKLEKIRQHNNNDAEKRSISNLVILSNGSSSPRTVVDVHERQQQNEIETCSELVSAIKL